MSLSSSSSSHCTLESVGEGGRDDGTMSSFMMMTLWWNEDLWRTELYGSHSISPIIFRPRLRLGWIWILARLDICTEIEWITPTDILIISMFIWLHDPFHSVVFDIKSITRTCNTTCLSLLCAHIPILYLPVKTNLRNYRAVMVAVHIREYSHWRNQTASIKFI